MKWQRPNGGCDDYILYTRIRAYPADFIPSPNYTAAFITVQPATDANRAPFLWAFTVALRGANASALRFSVQYQITAHHLCLPQTRVLKALRLRRCALIQLAHTNRRIAHTQMHLGTFDTHPTT